MSDIPYSFTKGEVLGWCRESGMVGQEDIASVFNISSQTVRNWERASEEPAPRWVCLCVAGLSAWLKSPLKDHVPHFPAPGHDWFGKWASHRGLETYEEKGRVFGYCRATVCKWYKRGLPPWLPLACLGADVLKVWARPEPVEMRTIPQQS